MAEVKWIKICTDIFDDEKILLIEGMPKSDSIILIWFKLLCLAGKQNNSGVIMLKNRTPYTIKMLATIFRMKESTVKIALDTFEQFGMIEIVDGVITIPNWGKHQNFDQLESKKAYMRKYMGEYREKQKALTSRQSTDKTNSKTNSKTNVSLADKDKEEDKEEDKEGEEKEKEKCRKIVDIFNSLCPSFPSIKFLSDSMKSAISKLLDEFPESDISTAFEKCEKSSFLKGNNHRKWKASFDWIIKPDNLSKILNGNYDDEISSDASYDLSEFRRKSLNEPIKYERNRKNE